MGNSPPTGGLRVGNSDYPCAANIGPFLAIEFSGRKVDQGKSTESWEMVYNTGTIMANCYFSLSRSLGKTRRSPTRLNERLEIKIDDKLFENLFEIQQLDEQGLLSPMNYMHRVPPSRFDYFRNDTSNAYGDITHTTFEIYGSGMKTKSLLVMEYKTRSRDRFPYRVTMTHYYVHSEKGEDVGLSMAVKNIGVSSNGNLDFAVDGPEKHPASALLYMIDEVRRTKTWKPTYCHHCADKIIQRQRAGIWQSDESGEDTDTYTGNVPAALVHGPTQNARGLLANDGRFRGNNNGNLNIENFYLRHRGRFFFPYFAR